MKKIIAIAMPIVFASSISAQAAESAVVNVKGTIVPGACNITVSGNADYGVLKKTNLVVDSVTNAYQLGTKEVSYLVSCDAPVKTAISFKGDENATQDSPYKVKVSSSSDGVVVTKSASKLGTLGSVEGSDIGYFVVLPTTPRGSKDGIVIDGVSGYIMIKSTDSGSSWTKAPTSYSSIANLDESMLYSWSKTSGTPLTPEAGSSIQGQLSIGAALNPTVVNSLKDSYSFNTNVTVLLSYL